MGIRSTLCIESTTPTTRKIAPTRIIAFAPRLDTISFLRILLASGGRDVRRNRELLPVFRPYREVEKAYASFSMPDQKENPTH
jgi:hypothetical protein